MSSAPVPPALAVASPGPQPQRPGRPGEAPAERFVQLALSHLERGSLEKLVLAKYRGAEPRLQRIVARPLDLRAGRVLSATMRHATRDVVKNLPVAEVAAWLREALGGAFGHAHLFAAGGEEAQLLVSRKGTATLRQGAPHAAAPPSGSAAMPARLQPAGDGDDARDGDDAAAAGEAAPAGVASHDRPRRRHVDIAAPFLVELGVTDAAHRLIPSMARKWRQIDRFVELLDHALDRSALKAAYTVRVADFGAGKGYLTFAVHDHLRRRPGMSAPRVVGVEWREDMVRLCNDAAARLGLEGLSFVRGDVRDHPLGAIDVMIALHACDTATDHAIHRGVRAGASIIMTSPCCHKELRPQLRAPSPLGPLLRHGIHMTQQAEMVTDGLRALLLEAEGYETQVFEFVSPEHTGKNKMILAVRRPQAASGAQAEAARRERVRAQIAELMSFYAVREQTLERLLRPQVAEAEAPGEG